MDIKPARKRPVNSGKKPSGSVLDPKVFAAPRQKSGKKLTRAERRRFLIRYAIVGVNLLIVGVFIFFVVKYSGGNAATYSLRASDTVVTSPLDRMNAADIAVNVARMTNLPEQAAVTMFADTINAEIQNFGVSRDFAFAPQIMTANIKTLADIEEYVTVEGDTVSGLASRFKVTSDSIRWSNDLLGETLTPGVRLLIPPMNGIIYMVRANDTVQRIASLYKVPESQVIAFNDAEVTGLQPGMRIFLPNATKPAPVFNFFVRYGNNGYEAGNCTYYAAAKGGAPAGWGHAKSWASGASRTPGWVVSKVPVRGAIAHTTGMSYLGHVAIVEDVKEEGGQIFIRYSDMNGIAGFDRVGHSGWVPVTTYQNYIYKAQ